MNIDRPFEYSTVQVRECVSKSFAPYISSKLAALRSAYKKALKSKNSDQRSDLLRSDFQLLETEGRKIIPRLKHMRLPVDLKSRYKLPVIFFEFSDAFLNCKCAIDQESLSRRITKIQKSRTVTINEFSNLDVILRAVLIDAAHISLSLDADSGYTLLKAVVKGLYDVKNIDFDMLLEQCCFASKLLSRDPAGVYDSMDDKSKHLYLELLSIFAKKHSISETDAASHIVSLAMNAESPAKRHVGYYLMPLTRHTERGIIMLLFEFLVPHIASLYIAFSLNAIWLYLLLFLPLREGLRYISQAIFSIGVKSYPLPRIDTFGSVPDNASTLVTVSTFLPPASNANELEKKLKSLYLTNPRGSIGFCILADLKNAAVPELPHDELDIQASREVVKKLNKKYGHKFFLAVRKRRYSKTQDEFTGYERKRGAIAGLARYIKGDERSDFICIEGDTEFLKRVKYIAALDGDTSLLLDTIPEMVGAALHPLNRPVLSHDGSHVVSGYGIIAPRIETDLRSFIKTPFVKLMTGAGGISSYESAAAERYQDFFGDSIFCGKGLIDVDAFYSVMNQRLPDECVLSHDILEGGFLRTGFMSDIQMTDGFPSGEGSYSSRQHRWIRGDWQNIRFIFNHYSINGVKTENKLSTLSKYKLADNVLRSASPIFSLLLFVVAAFLPVPSATVISLAAILGCTGAELFSAVRDVFSGGFSTLSGRYYSNALPSALSSTARAFYNLCTLPITAYVSADAAVRAAYRSLFSKKKLLEWKTSSVAESGKEKVISRIIHLSPSAIFGILLFVLSQAPVLKLAAILFTGGIPLSLCLSRPSRSGNFLLEKVSREKILSYASSMWRYYDELCTESDNYLPPDNIQEAPVERTAHRTSPTNIGLMMLSTLAARDLGFIDTDKMYHILNNVTSTVEKLEKFEGHLLNWYDTKTLKALNPRVVSTVDSGNFICCLTALRQGLEEYLEENKELRQLSLRIENLEKSADFRLLYDRRRNLFRIAYDIESGELSPSCYDLLMSESRMTSYYAIATRAVPKKHWGALGRTLARDGRFTGCVSWSGTTFEYFMPYILLPSHAGTLSYESLKFCIRCQMQRVARSNIPWGISESDFFSFDNQMNYQYKAHGVQKLALKRGVDRELVLSPYSTFLALPCAPQSAMRNIEKLEKMKMRGRYGLYEAVDFTKKRISNRKYAIVKSFMAHHVGMGLLSCCNALKGNIMQKRFMSNENMEAAHELLEEKLPIGAVVFRDALESEAAAPSTRPAPVASEHFSPSISNPRVHLLTNGELSLAVCDSGESVCIWRGTDVTRRSSDSLRRPQGIFAAAKVNGTVIPFSYAPLRKNSVEYTALFSDTSCELKAKDRAAECTAEIYVHPQLPAFQYSYTVKNTTSKRCSADVLIYLEPCLAKYRDDAAHPAFSKLFLEPSLSRDGKSIVFSRRPRRDISEHAALAIGVSGADIAEMSASRDEILQTPLGLASLPDLFRKKLEYGGYSPDPCLALKVRLDIPPKSSRSFDLAAACAVSSQDASSLLADLMSEETIPASHAARLPFPFNSLEHRVLSDMLPSILFGHIASDIILSSRRDFSFTVNDLWQTGVSGDFPIVLLELDSKSDPQSAIPYFKAHRILRICGIFTDLVIIDRSGQAGMTTDLKRIAAAEECEKELNIRAGIHIFDVSDPSSHLIDLFRYAAVCIGPYSDSDKNVMPELVPSPILPAERLKNIVSGFEGGGYNVNSTVPAPFCHVLANSQFGTMVSCNSLGFTWAINSRENRLTPWINDTAYDNRGEMMLIKTDTGIFDLCMFSTCRFSRDKAQYFGKVGFLEYEITVEVGAKGMKKNVSLNMLNTSPHDACFEASYYTEPVLGVDRNRPIIIKACSDENVLLLSNPYKSPAKGFMFLAADMESSFCMDRPSFLAGKWRSQGGEYHPFPCAAAICTIALAPYERKTVNFCIGFSATKKGAYALVKSNCHKRKPDFNSLSITSPDKNLDAMVNYWLPSQIFCSRIYGRTGFYQGGGAYGFRDQLQDVCSILTLSPETAKYQILRAASVQFPEGDVLHWFHVLPGSVSGVRTRYSDDLLWLPYAVCEYIRHTGDFDILNTKVRYLSGDKLKDSEHEKYFTVSYSDIRGTIYEHCMRAISHTMRYGEHNLPLIGGGDWNDGFNRIGIAGKGESVWLAQFFVIVLRNMSLLADVDISEKLKGEYEKIIHAVDETCWDNNWYIRAFFDNGESIGTLQSDECKIDILPQAFSVLANMPDSGRKNSALDAALKYLVDKEYGVIRLFAPAFTGHGKDPGYTASYPPGIRENGGQYTHAAVWLALALFNMGRNDEAYELIKILNPANKYDDPFLKSIYKREPYALCGDVYYHQDRRGMGGWSLYTGSASWFYKTVVEDMYGITVLDGKLFISPHLPSDWHGYSAKLKIDGADIDISVSKDVHGMRVDGQDGFKYLTLDGKPHTVICGLKNND